MSAYFVTKAECSRQAIFPGVVFYTTSGERMTASLVEFEPHGVVEMHDHPHEQMGLLLEGELEFFIGDEHRVLQPGDLWRIPGGVPHKAVAGAQPVRAIDFFSPIREDYR